MTCALDTSVLVRILVGSPQPLASQVVCEIERRRRSGAVFRISNLVLSETYYAVQYHYGVSKASVLNALRILSAQKGFEFTSEAVAALSLPDIDRAAPGFVDRLIHGEQHRLGIRILSCEKKFRKLPDAEILS